MIISIMITGDFMRIITDNFNSTIESHAMFSVAGLPIIVKKIGSPYVNIRFNFKFGSNLDLAGKEGICHFLEHLIFLNAEGLSREAFQLKMKSLGEFNGYTDYENMCFYADVLKEDWIEALKLLILMLNGDWTFADTAIEKSTIEKEIIMREPYEYWDEWFKHYSGLAERTGTIVSLNNISNEDVKEFKKSYLTLGALNISITGDIDINLDEIELILSDLKLNQTGNVNIVHPPPFNLEPFQFQNKLNEAGICLFYPGREFKDIYESNFADYILRRIIGHDFGSLLYIGLRESGLSYDFTCYVEDHRQNRYFNLQAMSSQDKLEECKKVLYEVVGKVKQGKFSQELFEASLKSFRYGFLNNFQTPEDYGYLLDQYIFWDRIIEYDEVIKKLDLLTKDDIINCANIIFKESPCECIKIAGGK